MSAEMEAFHRLLLLKELPAEDFYSPTKAKEGIYSTLLRAALKKPLPFDDDGTPRPARTVGDASSDFAATVSQRDSRAIISVTRHGPDGCVHRNTAQRHAHHVATYCAEFAHRRWRNQQRVVPRDLGDWIRKFLQPTEIGEAPVEDFAVKRKREFHRAARHKRY